MNDEGLPITGFTPDSGTIRQYRNALGQFGTGVAIVTCADDRGDFVEQMGPGGVGMTINSFSSVSLEPPLVLWSLSKSSGRHAVFKAAPYYAIHVLCVEQRELAFEFAKRADAFDSCPWELGPHNVPCLKGSLARFDCRQSAIHDGGDHAIIVGEVMNVVVGEGAPLIFSQGAFGSFLASQ